ETDERFDVFEIIGPSGEFVERAGTYAGWLRDWRGMPFVFPAVRAREETAEKIARAAEDHHWGRHPESFREIDYEADVATAFLAPGCDVVGEPDGRAFRGPRADTKTLGPPGDVVALVEALLETGLPAGGDSIDWPLALAEATDAESMSAVAEAIDEMLGRDRALRLTDEPVPSAPVEELGLSTHLVNSLRDEGIETLGELARMTPMELFQIRGVGKNSQAEIRDVLEELGVELGSEVPEPEGSQLSEEPGFDAEGFLDWLGFSADGSFDHPRTEGWRRHPVQVLELPEGFHERTGLRGDWSVERALDRAENQLGEEAAAELRRAVELHRVRLRWLGLVDRINQPVRYTGG
ncbi:MAG: DNA-directed RNA polymerase subunit alpha C-terminal domain-containing protein, partial [Bradymonadaceae bacterium]